MKNKTVLFFDFYGTLVKPSSIWSRAICVVAQKNGYSVDQSLIREQLDGFTWDYPENDYTHLTNPDNWWDHTNKAFEAVLLKNNIKKDLVKDIRSLVIAKENYTPFDDTITVLNYLKNKGYTLAVLSNNFPELYDVLKELEMDIFFDKCLVSSLVGYEKPHKEIFNFAKRQYPDINNFYMIGDNPVADIKGAKDCGFSTILVNNTSISEADYTFSSLSGLLQIF